MLVEGAQASAKQRATAPDTRACSSACEGAGPQESDARADEGRAKARRTPVTGRITEPCVAGKARARGSGTERPREGGAPKSSLRTQAGRATRVGDRDRTAEDTWGGADPAPEGGSPRSSCLQRHMILQLEPKLGLNLLLVRTYMRRTAQSSHFSVNPTVCVVARQAAHPHHVTTMSVTHRADRSSEPCENTPSHRLVECPITSERHQTLQARMAGEFSH